MGPKKKIKQVKLDEWDVRVAVENEGEEELSFSKKEKKKKAVATKHSPPPLLILFDICFYCAVLHN